MIYKKVKVFVALDKKNSFVFTVFNIIVHTKVAYIYSWWMVGIFLKLKIQTSLWHGEHGNLEYHGNSTRHVVCTFNFL